MRLGLLRHRVTLQEPVTSRDAAGSPRVTSWTEFATKWAKVEALSGRELLQSQQTKSAYTYRVTLRYLAGVNQDFRVVFGSLNLEIVSMIPDATNTELVLMCVEVK